MKVDNDKEVNTRAYFTQNLEMDHVTANALRDQRSLGNKSDKACKTIAYNIITFVSFAPFKVNVITGNAKNHNKLQRKWYRIISDILSQSGFDGMAQSI